MILSRKNFLYYGVYFFISFQKEWIPEELGHKKKGTSLPKRKKCRTDTIINSRLRFDSRFIEQSFRTNLMILLSLTSDSSIVRLINFVSVLLKLFEIWECYLTWSRHQGIRWDQRVLQQNAHTLRRNRKPLWELYSILEIIQQLWLTSAKVAYATHSIRLVQVGIKF